MRFTGAEQRMLGHAHIQVNQASRLIKTPLSRQDLRDAEKLLDQAKASVQTILLTQKNDDEQRNEHEHQHRSSHR